jgi:AcrR family transcriptional regulator
MPDSVVIPPIGRRVPAEDRRAQLIDTAMTLFARNGFSGTTTREIARAAGVNEAIIFRFFPHKDDLYAAILERKSNEACTDAFVDDLRAAAAAGDDEAVIGGVIRRIVEHHRADPQFLRLMLHSALEGHSFARQYRERHFAPLHQFLVEYVTARQQAGRFRQGDTEALVHVVLAVPVHHGLVESLLPEEKGPFTGDVVGVYTSLILDGLRASSLIAAAREGQQSSSSTEHRSHRS